MRLRGIVAGLIVGLVAASLGSVATAALKLPALIGDNMVLQQGQAVPLWGWAKKGAEVRVSIAGQSLSTKADDQGRWKVTLAKLETGGPHELTIKAGNESRTLKNVLVGEVWVCSGQSNMEMGVGVSKDAKQEIAAGNFPKIRLFTVERHNEPAPLDDCKGNCRWAECSPATLTSGFWGGFSAAAYYFGRELHKQLNVPIGLIHTSWGGTPAEVWTSRKALEAEPTLKDYHGSGMYNGMIAPLIPYGIRGAVWYQGEANIDGAYHYRTLLPTMIRNWRTDWGQGDFPFYIVQIAPFHYNAWLKPSDRADPRKLQRCAELWDAQLLTHKTLPNTGLVVTTDITELGEIHPHNKQEVGRRLALWALAKTYGRDLVCSGPLYKSMSVEGRKVRLDFDYAQGLKSADGKPLSFFTIAAADQKFVPAEARIDGQTIVVGAKEVDQPVAVRFGWREDATPNLVNGANLPASPFRTDRFKGVTQP